MARNVVSVYVKPKRKSHPHSKNASAGQNKYKKPYKGQGRWVKELVKCYLAKRE